MVMSKNKLSRYADRLVLIVILILFVLKFAIGGCRIWVCLIFVATITAWLIFSDRTKENKNDS